MNRKSLTPQGNDFGNRLTIKDLPIEFVELPDEALSQVCGGKESHKGPRLQLPNFVDAPDSVEIDEVYQNEWTGLGFHESAIFAW
jgi:hypothetical protein